MRIPCQSFNMVEFKIVSTDQGRTWETLERPLILHIGQQFYPMPWHIEIIGGEHDGMFCKHPPWQIP